MRTLCAACLLILLVALPAAGQGNAAVMQQKLQEMKPADAAKEVLRELTQSEYRAKADIPAVDCIFVEDGKVDDPTYRYAMKENPRALKAGDVTKVSSVKVMDHGIQIFLATGTCALIGISSSPVNTSTMTVKELVQMAQKALGALFETVPPPKAEVKAENKEEAKKK